ncbi:ATP synthase F1 subunit gamma [Blautia glucerasea]|uniref:ATP synthase F1 subunit gamma n=1 Tax=Blautia glucerasea TaxID=536633 RepID=UPI001D006F13|nr:ATP synthase F1 subunit gamma [Blautia glucerasea]MCB5387599.1 ATP synthase F1 subunit gamma [Blautia glucerasea]MCB5421936.1 ATP synthase F1 subunit gamma [Blautia luti]
MAANMKAVKLRIKSVQSTMQITKAMELVASSKLRKAKERAEVCRPYFETMHQTLADIAQGNTDFSSVYARESQNEKRCYVLIAGDRGLAGGYNTNLFKCLEAASSGQDFLVLPIGKKAVEYSKRNGFACVTESFGEIADISVADCFEMANLLCGEFKKGEFGHIDLCYTRFVSMLSQQPSAIPVLPLNDLTKEQDIKSIRNLILYEPDASEVFEAIVPEYLAGLIYGAVCESVASELAARRTAMEAATNNAEEMIEKLNLHYNRARQASITQEITEIVGGAEGV